MTLFRSDEHECMDCLLLDNVGDCSALTGWPDTPDTGRHEDCPLPVVKQEKWISVKERLPEEGGRIFVRCIVWCEDNGGVRTHEAIFDARYKTFQADRHNITGSVISWQPLPSPPQDTEEEGR